MVKQSTKKDTVPQCSFCHKSKDETETLIAGSGVFICEECVAVCNGILREKSGLPPEGPRPGV